MSDTAEFIVNRVEVIDHTKTGKGRDFVKWEDFDFEVGFDQQDGGRTLKIFLSERTDLLATDSDKQTKDTPMRPERL